MKEYDIHGDGRIGWYPQIYANQAEPRSKITIGLYHVRAANDIDIEYNAERDGWVVYQTVTTGYSWVEQSQCQEPVEERREMAFIPAWAAEIER